MNFCGLEISCPSYGSLWTQSPCPRILVTVNAEAIVKAQNDSKLLRIINENSASIDGQIPLWLYRLIYPKEKIEKISGSDLIYSIPEYAMRNNLRVFLLGGQTDSNEVAVKKLRIKYPGLIIDGYSPSFHPYPFSNEINEQIEKKLELFRPDILFVGFGMGKQEYWEDDNKLLFKKLGTKLIIGCGGSFEFASGKIKRAPVIIQKSGLEGLWRFLNELKWFRFKRLMVSSKIFYYCFKYHML